jgi:hypothetical protein
MNQELRERLLCHVFGYLPVVNDEVHGANDAGEFVSKEPGVLGVRGLICPFPPTHRLPGGSFLSGNLRSK